MAIDISKEKVDTKEEEVKAEIKPISLYVTTANFNKVWTENKLDKEQRLIYAYVSDQKDFDIHISDTEIKGKKIYGYRDEVLAEHYMYLSGLTTIMRNTFGLTIVSISKTSMFDFLVTAEQYADLFNVDIIKSALDHLKEFKLKIYSSKELDLASYRSSIRSKILFLIMQAEEDRKAAEQERRDQIAGGNRAQRRASAFGR